MLLLTVVGGINCARLFPTSLKDARGPLVTKRLYVDDTFQLSEIRCIEEAADRWTRRTKGLAKIVVVPITQGKDTIPSNTTIDDILLVRSTSDTAIVFFIERLSGAALYGYHQALRDHSEITLVVDRYSTNTVCVSVVMHELGHSMGIHHNDDPTSLMYGGVDGMPTAITRRDLTDFCSVHGCRVDELDD